MIISANQIKIERRGCFSYSSEAHDLVLSLLPLLLPGLVVCDVAKLTHPNFLVVVTLHVVLEVGASVADEFSALAAVMTSSQPTEVQKTNEAVNSVSIGKPSSWLQLDLAIVDIGCSAEALGLSWLLVLLCVDDVNVYRGVFGDSLVALVKINLFSDEIALHLIRLRYV